MAEEIATTNGTAEPAPPPAQPAWYESAASLKLTDPDIWESFENGVKSGSNKDLPTLIKKAVSAEKRLGQVLTPPERNATPEQREAFHKRLRDIGVLPAIPESPDKYELKLDGIPENLQNPELIGEFKQWAHKRGISAEVANELLELNAKQFVAANQLYEGTLQEAETRIAEMAKRDGKDMNAIMEGGKRAAQSFLRDSPKTLEKLNTYFGNDPDIMYALARMGEALGEDTAELGDQNTGTNPNAALVEANDIIRNKQNSKYEAYHRGDPAVTAYVEQLLKKAVPGTIEI